MSTVISFVSQKGGVGKTTSAINLSVGFAFGGAKVLLIDLDPQSSVRFSFDINEGKVGTKELILDNNPKIGDLIIKTTEHDNLDFILSNIDSMSEEREVNRRLTAYDYLYNILKNQNLDYDYIIIDAPSSTNNLAINALVASDIIILPLQCENLAIKSLKRFLVSFYELQNILSDKEFKLAGVLLTRYNKNSEVHQRIAKQLYQALSDAIFQSIIPDSEEIVESSALGKSVITYKLGSTGATAYLKLLEELTVKFSI